MRYDCHNQHEVLERRQAPVKQMKLGIVKSRLVLVSLTLMLLDLCAVDELFLFIFRIGLEYSLI